MHIYYTVRTESRFNVACYNGVNDETVRELREMCSKEVAENNGIITFEEALHFQNSED